MREILFRGKRIDNGEWVEGSLIAWPDGSAEICYDNPENDDEFLKSIVYPETVGQYTGMTDKNGKKIFEGDVCKVGNLIYKVVLEYSAWWFKILSNKVYCCPAFNSHCGDLCEIIGNIHDNPEFLEVPHE